MKAVMLAPYIAILLSLRRDDSSSLFSSPFPGRRACVRVSERASECRFFRLFRSSGSGDLKARVLFRCTAPTYTRVNWHTTKCRDTPHPLPSSAAPYILLTPNVMTFAVTPRTITTRRVLLTLLLYKSAARGARDSLLVTLDLR